MRYILLLLFIAASTAAVGQYKTVQLCNEHHMLNSGSRSFFDGISRVTIPLTIPDGTEYIYYSISTDQDENVNPINLVGQITALMTGYSSIATLATLAGEVKGTKGIAPLCTYLVLRKDFADAFNNKDDGSWNYYIPASRENMTGGTVSFDVPKLLYGKTVYLGFKNPSSYEALYFNVEAVAVVKE